MTIHQQQLSRRDSLRTLTALGVAAASAPWCKIRGAALASAQPFLATYARFNDLFDARSSTARRTAAIASELDRMAACGLNTVIIQATTTSGQAEYPSRLIPRRTYGDWDPLAVLVKEARERKLRVFTMQCAMVCGHLTPKGILEQHPDWAVRDLKGNPLGFISPAHPQARWWVASVSRELVDRYQPDGLLLDYLRYSGDKIQLDPAAAIRWPTPPADAPPAVKHAFQKVREDALTEQARLIAESARAARPALTIAVYSWGAFVARNHGVAQAWPTWADRGYVDHVNVSGYCYRENYKEKYLDVFEKRLADAVAINQKLARRIELSFALGIKTSHGGIASSSEVKTYLDRARRAGINGMSIFNWGHMRPFYDQVLKAGYIRELANR